MANKKEWHPGQQPDKDLELYAVDEQGNHLGEISVPAGSRIPPTRFENAVKYVEQ